MGNRQKKKEAAVLRLEQDIKLLDANDLEFVGHALIELLAGKTLIHRGVNRTGRPVGYTLDTFSSDRVVVGEYSAEADYFDAPFNKLSDDCLHALKLAPNCTMLYCISSQPCKNAQWAGVSKTVRSILGKAVDFEVYDSLRLATEVYDKVILRTNFIEFFSDFLPRLTDLWNEHIVTNASPDVPPDFVSDAERMQTVIRALEAQAQTGIYGLSGSGKTLCMMEYAKNFSDRFASTIWIDGDDLAEITNLASVRIGRLGIEMNLTTHLRTSACLLIVDDLKRDTACLASLLPNDMHPDSRIVVTCIQTPGTGFVPVELPAIPNTVARAILSSGIAEAPTDSQLYEIFNFVGNHPLTLAVIRDTVRESEASWQDIVDDLHNIPKYETNDQETILHRILLKRNAGIADELCVLRWLNTNVIDASFGLAMFRPGGLAKLLRRSILRRDSRALLRMHDIVFACVRQYEGHSFSDENAETRLMQFFSDNWERGSYHFQRALQVHADVIKRRVQPETPKPNFHTYLYILNDSTPKPPSFLHQLSQTEISEIIPDHAGCMCIVEAIERESQVSRLDGNETVVIESGIENISRAIPLAPSSKFRADLLHHRGKLHYWRPNHDAAMKDFEAVLQLDPYAFHTHLQIARIKAEKREQSSADHLEIIFRAFEEDNEAVSITTVLAAFGDFEKPSNRRLRKIWLAKNHSLLRDAISLGVAQGFSAPHRTLGRLSKYLYYESPDLLLGLSKLVNFPSAAHTSGHEAFEIGECLKSVGKACAESPVDRETATRWFDEAWSYYQRDDDNREYRATMKAECLIRLRRFEDALKLLDTVSSSSNSMHWWHRRAQSLVGLGLSDESLKAIERALALNRDQVYVSALLLTKAEAEAAEGMPSCLETLKQAMNQADSQKFRNALGKKLTDLENRFQ